MMLWGMHVILAGTFELFLDSCCGKIQPKQKWWLAFFLTFVTSRRSQLQWTLSKRPLLVSDQPFCFSVKYCFKNSLESDHYFNFLSDHDHFLGWKCDIFVCYLFPESDHPVWSRMIVKKPLLEWHKSSVYDSADQTGCYIWAIGYVPLRRIWFSISLLQDRLYKSGSLGLKYDIIFQETDQLVEDFILD